ncbi:MAG: glycoside hydrolase family 5 protein [Lachnospiraceae bacterium]|nr:glycoside hydrolase family 5 protein [Lachnospiraceae bacterium]
MGEAVLREWKGFRKGINLGGWFSQSDSMSKAHFDTFITEDDFDVIKSWGLDHVRLPIDYDLIVDRSGNFKTSGFAYIDKVIEWCRARKLNVVINLHKADGYEFINNEKYGDFFESEILQEKFYEIWTHIAEKYGKYSDSVAFDLLSDITDVAYSEPWNQIIRHCISRIRFYAPMNVIVIGGCKCNSCTVIGELPDPNDKWIAYTFHFNGPHIFTHQGAHWVEWMPQDFRFSFDHTYREYMDETAKLVGRPTGFKDVNRDPDSMLDSGYFEDRMAEAVKIAAERDKYLYCGEYGVINNADPSDTVKWYREINKAFEKYNIGRAAWSYRAMSFGLADEEYDGVRDELVKYL